MPDALAAVRAALAGGPLHPPRGRRRRPRERRAARRRPAGAGAGWSASPRSRGTIIEAAPAGHFALTDDWLGPSEPLPDRDAAITELARRHARAHPPAGPEDFAAWSGIGLRDARRAYEQIAGDLDEVEVLGRSAWVPRGLEPAPPHVRLLPAFDGILLGHRDRELIVRPEHARDVLPGGGILRPTLLVDGRVEGTWRLERGRPRVSAFGAASGPRRRGRRRRALPRRSHCGGLMALRT